MHLCPLHLVTQKLDSYFSATCTWPTIGVLTIEQGMYLSDQLQSQQYIMNTTLNIFKFKKSVICWKLDNLKFKTPGSNYFIPAMVHIWQRSLFSSTFHSHSAFQHNCCLQCTVTELHTTEERPFQNNAPEHSLLKHCLCDCFLDVTVGAVVSC